MKNVKNFTKNLPTLITAILMSMAVWILAVTNIDPVERRTFNHPVSIEVIGQSSTLTIMNDIPDQVTITLSAPISVWGSALNANNAIRAVVDLANLEAGEYELPVSLQVNARPVKVESFNPSTVIVQLEELVEVTLPINLVQASSPPVGFDVGAPQINPNSTTVRGPSSLIEQISEVRAVLDISQDRESIDRNIPLVALDKNGLRVNGMTLTPEIVNVKQELTQRGGYRNVGVKVVTDGQIASGYRLTNISANPLVVTVFSSDPELVNNLPGFIETLPVDLTDAKRDLEVTIPLNVPAGILAVGESSIKVSIAISPIQGSVTLAGVPIEITGTLPEYEVEVSPDRVDVIFSGPLPTLDQLKISDIRVLIDLTDKISGIYQLEPQVEITIPDVLVESILPATIEVEITPLPPNSS